ncbi:MAG: beta-galactosidase [Capsulimonadaceae bacterium]|nr:beta-galactosidase [Capsulimonadaceae bacterium]
MTSYTRRQLFRTGVGALSAAALIHLSGQDGEQPALASTTKGTALPAAGPSVARIERINGIPTFIVDGQPFLINGSHLNTWQAYHQDKPVVDFFDWCQRVNCTAVGMELYWSFIETSEGVYDFSSLNWIIKQSEAHGLKLVLQLYNSNVCGTIENGSDAHPDPVWVPKYIREAPDKYQRIVLPPDCEKLYVSSGPPMCPNDPRTLERERKYMVRLADYLREHDRNRTVIMAQVNNEYVCWVYKGSPEGNFDWTRVPDGRGVRCICPYCDAKWNAGYGGNCYEFMYDSFADYTRVLSDAFRADYPLPLYLNSPGIPPDQIRGYLGKCPNIAIVGIDEVIDPHEPNELCAGQVCRNIAFAAEVPTQRPKTRFFIDVLPYYFVIGLLGIGHLLWDAPPPDRASEDEDVSRRYEQALYPLKYAQSLIARYRGTAQLSAWYALRDFESDYPQSTFVREGAMTRIESLSNRAYVHDIQIGNRMISVRASEAGVAIAPSENVLVIGTPRASIDLKGVRVASVENGQYVGDAWHSMGAFAFEKRADGARLQIREPSVLRIQFA